MQKTFSVDFQKNHKPEYRLLQHATTYVSTYAQSPFVSLLSRRTQSGRWSSFGKWVWFT